MVTDNLNVDTMSDGQSQPANTHNDALNHLVNLLGEPALNEVSGASPPLTLTEATDSNSITSLSFNGAFFFQINGDTTESGTGTMTVPGIRRGLFVVFNNTLVDFDVEVSGQSNTTDSVAAGEFGLFACVHVDTSGDETSDEYQVRAVGSDGGGGGGSGFNGVLTLNSPSGTDYDVVSSDAGKLIIMNEATANTVSLPDDATDDLDIGFTVYVLQMGTGQTSFNSNGSPVIDTPEGLALRKQWSVATATKRAADTWVVSGDLELSEPRTILPSPTELTIATGAVTATQSYHVIDTESDAASDDLDTISGGIAGQRLVLRAANDARTVVLTDGTGNLRLAGGDFSLTSADDAIELLYDDTNWLEMSRSDNTT